MTIVFIVINVYTFFLFLIDPPFDPLPLCLEFGDGIKPWQWVSSLFMHADFFHLLGNMLFLWVFGLIVEGKIGWLRFGLLYLSLGALGSALEQLYMLNATGIALGASGAIYSIMAIALLWAPRNSIFCWFIYFISLFHKTSEFEIKVSVLAVIYICFDLVILWLNDFQMSGELAHLLGAILGGIAGYAMLKLNWVDCEGWDFFTLWKQGGPDTDLDELRKYQTTNATHDNESQKTISQEEQGQLQAKQDFLMRNLTEQIKSGQLDTAKETYLNLKVHFKDLKLSPNLLLRFAQLAEKSDQTDFAIELLIVILKSPPQEQVQARVYLASLLVKQERPAKAISVLKKVNTQSFSGKWESHYKAILTKATQMQQSGDYLEMEDSEEW